MKTLKLFAVSIYLCIFSVQTLGGELEGQRKYLFKTLSTQVLDFVENGGELGALKIFKHSNYTYYDIYLDTEKFDIYQNKLSLRFRKRDYGNGKISYGLQLKSEMEGTDGNRMEIDEKELSIYQVFDGKDLIPLTKILDLFFHIADNGGQYNKKSIQGASELLYQWIKFKQDAPIAPFMKLRRYYKNIQMDKLKVSLVGVSKRMRSHIYSVKDELETNPYKNYIKNQISLKKLPTYFRKNQNFNWFMESSFDRAVFYPMFKSDYASHKVVEYEVENKYFNPEVGSTVMNLFEKDLFSEFDVLAGRDSKFSVSIKYFYF